MILFVGFQKSYLLRQKKSILLFKTINLTNDFLALPRPPGECQKRNWEVFRLTQYTVFYVDPLYWPPWDLLRRPERNVVTRTRGMWWKYNAVWTGSVCCLASFFRQREGNDNVYTYFMHIFFRNQHRCNTFDCFRGCNVDHQQLYFREIVKAGNHIFARAFKWRATNVFYSDLLAVFTGNFTSSFCISILPCLCSWKQMHFTRRSNFHIPDEIRRYKIVHKIRGRGTSSNRPWISLATRIKMRIVLRAPGETKAPVVKQQFSNANSVVQLRIVSV